MILINNASKNKEYFSSDKDELNNAEMTLTGNIVLKADFNTQPKECVFPILIPYVNYNGKYSHEKEMVQDDIILGCNDTTFATVKHKAFDSVYSVHLRLDDVPLKYNYIDIFIYPDNCDYKVHALDTFFSIAKEENLRNKLFTYSREFDKNLYGIMAGTLGRLDSGWKFYPKFYEVIMGKSKLLRLYLGREYWY